METSEQINCPAPLPEDPTDALLTEMRTLAPYEVPEKAKGTRKSSRRQVVSDTSYDNSETHSSRESEEEDEDSPPPAGGDKKRKASFRTVPPPPPTAKTSGYSGPSPW